jgi:hypothetical protein
MQLAVVAMLEASQAVVDAGHRVALLCNKIKIDRFLGSLKV